MYVAPDHVYFNFTHFKIMPVDPNEEYTTWKKLQHVSSRKCRLEGHIVREKAMSE